MTLSNGTRGSAAEVMLRVNIPVSIFLGGQRSKCTCAQLLYKCNFCSCLMLRFDVLYIELVSMMPWYACRIFCR